MKRILCPVDFSKSVLNGLEYAAQLARVFNASLLLFYVRTTIWPESIQLERDINESTDTIQTHLSLLSQQVNGEFGIPCHFHLESTTLTFEESVANQAKKIDLIVMGTNGADNYYQYLFGSNSFHVIEKSKCPILVVPENCAYGPIKLVVYAYDPQTNPILLVDQLRRFVIPTGAEVRVLYIVEEKPSEIINRELEILRDAVNIRAPKDMNWSFSAHFAREVSQALLDFTGENNADVLALSFHHRSLFDKMFSENTIKKLSSMAKQPMFVFWH